MEVDIDKVQDVICKYEADLNKVLNEADYFDKFIKENGYDGLEVAYIRSIIENQLAVKMSLHFTVKVLKLQSHKPEKKS